MEWRKENRCFLSIHKAFNFSMYSDLSLNFSLSLSLSLLFLCIYQSFLSTYKDIIGKLSIHHIMFFAYGSSKRKWKPFLLLLSLQQNYNSDCGIFSFFFKCNSPIAIIILHEKYKGKFHQKISEELYFRHLIPQQRLAKEV